MKNQPPQNFYPRHTQKTIHPLQSQKQRRQNMTKTELKEKILANSANYFLRDKKHKGYICPICGSGSGKNGTGITTKDNIHFTCWVGCPISRTNSKKLPGFSDILSPLMKKYPLPLKVTKRITQISFYGLIITSQTQIITVASALKPSTNSKSAISPTGNTPNLPK